MNDQKIKLNLNHPNKIKKTFSKLIKPVEQLISYEEKYNALMFIQSLENLKAENMFNKVMVKNPESIVMWYFKGYNLFKMKRFGDSIIAFDNASSSNQLRSKALFHKAITLYVTEKFENAYQTINMIPKTSRSESMSMLKAVCEYRLNNFENMIETCIQSNIENSFSILIKSCSKGKISNSKIDNPQCKQIVKRIENFILTESDKQMASEILNGLNFYLAKISTIDMSTE